MKTPLITMTLAMASGWAWACGSDSSPTLSADHCAVNDGDALPGWEPSLLRARDPRVPDR